MAYQVLARKWRPQVFSDLVGQTHVATTLINALKSDRMPHALLFTGARGVGKTSAARILAKSLRCPNARDFIPCNECDDCHQITSGHAVDVIEIDGASNNGVESIRELRGTVGYMPSRGKYKIYIIDEVHMLSTSAFNALLKTLEEPPPHVIFIFATTEPYKIPVTILSRCQRFDFRRIPIRKVAEHLKSIAEKEGIQSDEQSLWLIARESEGSMRDSQSLLDQVITFSGKKITYQKVVDVLGLTDRTLLSDTLKAVLRRTAQECLDIIERVFNFGYDPKQFAQDLLEHIRNLMIVKISGKSLTADFLDLPDTEIAELAEWSQEVSEDDIHLLFDMTLKGVNDVVRAQDPRIVLEMLLLRLTQAPRLVSIEKLLQQMESGQPVVSSIKSGSGSNSSSGTGAGSQTRTPPASRTPAGSTATAVLPTSQGNGSGVIDTSTGSLFDHWTELVGRIKKDKPLLGAKLEYASLAHADDQQIIVTFKKEQEFFFNQVNAQDTIKQITDLTRKHWGKQLRVEVQLVKTATGVPVPANLAQASNAGDATGEEISPKEFAQKKAQESEDKIRTEIESHPLIQEAKNVFKTNIKQIKETT